MSAGPGVLVRPEMSHPEELSFCDQLGLPQNFFVIMLGSFLLPLVTGRIFDDFSKVPPSLWTPLGRSNVSLRLTSLTSCQWLNQQNCSCRGLVPSGFSPVLSLHSYISFCTQAPIPPMYDFLTLTPLLETIPRLSCFPLSKPLSSRIEDPPFLSALSLPVTSSPLNPHPFQYL